MAEAVIATGDRLRAIIKGLLGKTLANGCTEAEALLATAKVAELLDRYDLSLTDVEIRRSHCERRIYEDTRNKRVPIGECVGAIAAFCNCRVWRERTAGKAHRYVFFGLAADIDAALYLTELIDAAIRTELSRFKTTPDYQDFRHVDRHLANASFALGMAGSIADKLAAMQANHKIGSGRDVMVVKTALVDVELAALDMQLRDVESAPRMISADAYDAGEAAGAVVGIPVR